MKVCTTHTFNVRRCDQKLTSLVCSVEQWYRHGERSKRGRVFPTLSRVDPHINTNPMRNDHNWYVRKTCRASVIRRQPIGTKSIDIERFLVSKYITNKCSCCR